MKKSQKIETKTILALAEKDYSAFKAEQKSYQLFNWLKDELILCQVHKINCLLIEPKALSRIINILAVLRERNLNSLEINILDRENAEVIFSMDMTTINNAERRRLNSEFNLQLEELTEDRKDETYAHMI